MKLRIIMIKFRVVLLKTFISKNLNLFESLKKENLTIMRELIDLILIILIISIYFIKANSLI